MYNFIGYVIELPDHNWAPQFFRSKQLALKTARENNLQQYSIVQVFRNAEWIHTTPTPHDEKVAQTVPNQTELGEVPQTGVLGTVVDESA